MVESGEVLKIYDIGPDHVLSHANHKKAADNPAVMKASNWARLENCKKKVS